MFNQLTSALERLRETLGGRTEKAYNDRDKQGISDHERSYAEGEAHAYGVAEADVRAAQSQEDNGS